jgi:hypothetical protein
MARDRLTDAVTVPTKLDLSPDPSIKGKEGAVTWYREVMGLDNVGLGRITKATNDMSLPSFKISGAVWYSTVDLYNFIARMRRSA